MVGELKLVVDVHDLDKKLEQKASKIGPEITRRTTNMLRTVENNVKFVTHRGQHCKGKGGTTKSAIRHKLSSNGGMVYADEGIAPWLKWYIEGRGPVEAIRAKFLRFCSMGKVIYRRRVKAWKGHNIMKEGLQRSESSLNQQSQSLGNWLQKI